MVMDKNEQDEISKEHLWDKKEKYVKGVLKL